MPPFSRKEKKGKRAGTGSRAASGSPASSAVASAAKKKRSRLGRFFAKNGKRMAKVALIALVIVVAWIPAPFINNVMGYAPGIFVTLGIALSGLYLRLLKGGLDYAEATRASECIRQENVDFVLRLQNRTVFLFPRIEVVFFQSDLFGGEGQTTSTDIVLGPKATRDFRFAMRFNHIGVYQAGFKRVILHDLLGLFSITFENQKPQRVEVLPHLEPLNDVSFDSEAPTQSTKAVKTVLNEGMDYSHVRDYRWGDPIKSIHWNLSARLSHFVTRIYETNANPGLATVIDLHATEQDVDVLMQLYDAVVEGALSLDDYARRCGLESTLIYMDDCGEEKRCEARLEEEGMREIAGLLKQDSTCYRGNAATLLLSELNSPYSQGNIALCTCALDNQLVETLLSIKTRRKNPILLYAIPAGLDKEQRAELLAPLRRLDEAQIAYCTFSDAAELKEGVR